MNYFVPIKIHSPTRKAFMYMDAADEYHVDSLLAKYKVHAKFRDSEFISPDGRYKFVMCSIPKKEIPQFELVMQEVPGRMLILGYRDYEEVWAKMMSFLEENKRK